MYQKRLHMLSVISTDSSNFVQSITKMQESEQFLKCYLVPHIRIEMDRVTSATKTIPIMIYVFLNTSIVSKMDVCLQK